MAPAWTLAALLLVSGIAPGQTTGILRVTVTLPDATQTPVPIANHALLISDSPPTRTPRRVVTAADGSVVVNLTPGSYVVESDRSVAFQGKAYQWTSVTEIVAGRETTVSLTGQNAEVVELTATPDTSAAVPDPEPVFTVGKWQTSLVTVWSPTSQASGFVVDVSGLIATDRHGVGSATSVEVQVSPTVKVPARVLTAEPTQDVAIVWVDPSVLTLASPIPLACPPNATPSLNDGTSIVAMTASRGGTGDVVPGEITGFHPRGIETNMRIPFGEAGGPVFTSNHPGAVGLTSARIDAESRRGDVLVVRAGIVCDTLSAARSKMAGTTPPAPTPLPVEPSRAYPTDATTTKQTSADATPRIVSSADFDIALITPASILQARERAGYTGGRSARTPEAEARLGRLTEFGPWAEYFAEPPPVLIVRVTPKLAESVWLRIAREAARTQGAALPAFKDFKANFLRLRASCGGVEVTPIHPFVLEHAVDEKRTIREGLYVFALDAFGPDCPSPSLTIWSEQAPEKGETVTLRTKKD